MAPHLLLVKEGACMQLVTAVSTSNISGDNSYNYKWKWIFNLNEALWMSQFRFWVGGSTEEQTNSCPTRHQCSITPQRTRYTDLHHADTQHPCKPGPNSEDWYKKLIWMADTEFWSSNTCISPGIRTICIHDAAGLLKDNVVWTISSSWLGASTALFSFHYLKEADLVAI